MRSRGAVFHRSGLARLLGLLALGLPLGAAASEADEAPGADGDVLVQGSSRGPTPARDSGVAASIIEGKDLEAAGATLGDVLARASGAQVLRSGAKLEPVTLSIRGASAGQLPVYLAGVRLNDEQGGGVDLSAIPLWMLDRVEVYRGNAPGIADRLGIAGALWLEPRRPDGSAVRAQQMLGSYASRATALGASVRHSRGALSAAWRHESAGNHYSFIDDRGTRFDDSDDARVRRRNADSEASQAWVLGAAELGPGRRLSWLLSGFEREQGITGIAVAPAERSRFGQQRALAALSARLPCAERESCLLVLSTHGMVGRSRLDDPDRELSLGAATLTTDSARVEQLARIAWRPATGVELGFAIEHGFETQGLRRRSEAGPQFVESASRRVLRPALTWEQPLGHGLRLMGVGALESHATTASVAQTRLALPVGRLSAVAAVATGTELFAAIGRGARPPTLTELHGVSPLVRGNDLLRAETGASAELGVRRGWSAHPWRFDLEATAFERRAWDLISYRRSLRQLVPLNVERAAFRGVELSGRAEGEGVTADGALSLLDPRDLGADGGNDVLPLRSRLTASVGLRAQKSLPRGPRLSLGGRFEHRSSRYQDSAGLVVIPGQSTLDLEASAGPPGEWLDVRARLENVTQSTRFDFVGLPLPGRALYVTLEAIL